MSKAKNIIGIGICNLIVHALCAQAPYAWLQIGDKVPDIKFDNVYHYDKESMRLSDFRGKLLILDFFNLSCAPCMKGFAKMVEIQEQFKDQVQILLVSVVDKKANFEREYGMSSLLRNTKLPFVIESAALESLFPHATVPYHVWIDSSGKVIATTAAYATTAHEVAEILRGGPVNMRIQPLLEDLGLAWGANNEFKSILQPSSVLVFENMLYSSVITKNLMAKGLSGSLADSASGKLIGYRISGDMIYLLKSSFDQFIYLSDNPDRVLLEIENAGDFLRPGEVEADRLADWESNRIFTYELKLPVSRMPENIEDQARLVRKVMRQDLERFFGVTASFEKRKIKCRVLIRKRRVDKSFTNQGDESHSAESANRLILQKQPFYKLTQFVQKQFMSISWMPFVDETGIAPDSTVEIDIATGKNDHNLFNRQLEPYGLTIVEKYRVLNVMVIKKRKE